MKLVTGSVADADVKLKEPTETRDGGSLANVDYSKATVKFMPLAKLTTRDDWNPRIILPGIDALSDDIRVTGLQKPIVVVEHKGKILIVQGHRRFAACKKIVESKKLGVFDPDKVPVMDLGPEKDERKIMMLYVDHGNVAKLSNEIEESRACANLKRAGMTQDEIAVHLFGRKSARSKVQYLLGISRLPAEWRDRYAKFLIARNEKKMDEIRKDETIPVFDQRTVQRLISAWNIENGVGRPDDVKDELAKDWKALTKAWEADKGRTLAEATKGKTVRSAEDVAKMRQEFAGSGEPAVKDAVLAVLDWFICKDGAEGRVAAYLKL